MTKNRPRAHPTRDRGFVALTAAILLLSGCAAATQPGKHDAELAARALACEELAGGGGVRPFDDDAPGVTKSELRAAHVVGYDRHEDELGPNEKIGVRYRLAARPGWSRAFLERQVHCYRATRAGTDPRDPLLVPEARVQVTDGVGGYLVDVTSYDREVARDVVGTTGS